MTLKGKVAIITGSTGGMGKSIAAHLASMGAHVVLTSRNIETAGKVMNEITDNGGSATPCCFELENLSSGETLIDIVIETCQRLDILVNNAVSHPTLPPLPLQNMDYAQLQAGITANLTNILSLTTHAYPHLKKTKGCVLNIGSIMVHREMLNIPLYTIVKGALTQMTRTLATNWAMDGIRVNQINPGFVQTDAIKHSGLSEEAQAALFEYFKQFHPLGRVGVPEDIGALAAYMLSDEAVWMTGSIVDMDGGYSVQGVPPPG